MTKTLRIVLPLGAALALAACSQTPEETSYETDTEDLSGGELIVTEQDPEAVPVDLPETEMTSVPDKETGEDPPAGSE